MATSIPAGGLVVVTHLHPAPQGALPVGTTPFSKGHPLVLGVRPSLSDLSSVDVDVLSGGETEMRQRQSLHFLQSCLKFSWWQRRGNCLNLQTICAAHFIIFKTLKSCSRRHHRDGPNSQKCSFYIEEDICPDVTTKHLSCTKHL